MDIVADNLNTDVLKARLVLVNGKDVVEYFEEVLDTRLSAGVKFVGEYDSLDVAPKVNGGIVIVGTKDYIYSETQDKWHEIGDEGQIGVLVQAVKTLSSSLSGFQPVGDYALKSDIPTAAEISADIHLSDYIKEIPNTYKTYVETSNSLSNDGYALKTDIPSAATISSEISLSDYSLTSHNHDETYLKEVPVEYKTYDNTVSSLSTDGYASTESLTAYAKTSDLSDIPTIKQDIIESKTQLSAMLSCLPLSKSECSLTNIFDALYSLKT